MTNEDIKNVASELLSQSIDRFPDFSPAQRVAYRIGVTKLVEVLTGEDFLEVDMKNILKRKQAVEDQFQQSLVYITAVTVCVATFGFALAATFHRILAYIWSH